MDHAAGEKPAETLHIGGKAGHQVAGLLPVIEGLGKVQGPFDEAVLEVEEDLLLEPGKIEFLPQVGQLFKNRHPQQQENRSHQEVRPAAQNDRVDEVAEDQRLGEGEERSDEDQHPPQGSFSPVAKGEGVQVFEIVPYFGLSPRSRELFSGRLSGQAALQIVNPGIHPLHPIPSSFDGGGRGWG
ncbi:MAG: hypothetical protein AMJ94_08180 [Deltaproteobacteria bacterium SM23_61]|nr:MAG: hypothetical protein AMJ94_08180 [Deltaproteobacteria bacterium SM23_61]